jgi:hypothetical protein
MTAIVIPGEARDLGEPLAMAEGEGFHGKPILSNGNNV